MTTPDPTTNGAPDRGETGESRRATGSAEQPLTTLRGAGVDFNPRKVAQVAIGLCMAALLVLVVGFTLAGVHRNDQINRLHSHGVAVEVTVTTCQGLLGGSGSNQAGSTCNGSFTFEGHRYVEAIPGDTARALGSTFQGIDVPGDPALLAPANALAAEHSSAKVFILPAVLLVALVLLVGAVLLRRRAGAGTPTP